MLSKEIGELCDANLYFSGERKRDICHPLSADSVGLYTLSRLALSLEYTSYGLDLRMHHAEISHRGLT